MSDLEELVENGDWELDVRVPLPDDTYELIITDAGDPYLVKEEYQNESGTKKRFWIEFTVDPESDEDYGGMSFRQYMGFSTHSKSTFYPIARAANGGNDLTEKINKAWLVGKRLRAAVTLSEPNAQGVRQNRIGTAFPSKPAKAARPTKKAQEAAADEPNF